nr:MAG TPA: Ellis van Creveld protein 2 like protein [Caudoviricetes sp.]
MTELRLWFVCFMLSVVITIYSFWFYFTIIK